MPASFELADPLADALAMYANATGDSDKPIRELQDEAIPGMRSAFEQLRGFFHGYDYSAALDQWDSVCDFVSGKALAAGGVPTDKPAASALSLRERDVEPVNVLRVYLGAIDHVLDVGQNVGEETGWKRFRGMVKRLSTAFALAVPREETKEITPHLAFFQRNSAS